MYKDFFMTQKFLIGAWLLLMAFMLPAGNFTISDDGSAALRGKELISNEQVMILDESYPIAKIAPEITKHNVKGKSVVNRLGKDEKLMPFRRETALSADGKQVELTFQARVDAFRVQIGETPKKYGYSFKTDVRDFDGGKY